MNTKDEGKDHTSTKSLNDTWLSEVSLAITSTKFSPEPRLTRLLPKMITLNLLENNANPFRVRVTLIQTIYTH